MQDERRIQWGDALIESRSARQARARARAHQPRHPPIRRRDPSLSGLDAGAWTLALPAVAFLGGPTFSVGVGALGWMIFTPEQRTLPAELAARAREHA